VPLPNSADAFLAADGGRLATVVYHTPADDPAAPAPRCRLTVVDVPAGVVHATRPVCAPRELVSGVAIETSGPAGPLVYLTVRADAPAGAGPLATGRIVAQHPETGATAAVLRLAHAPTLPTLGSAPGGVGRRLYVVEAISTPEQEPPAPYRGRLLGLHPATLQIEAEYPLDSPPSRLAIAPDGDDAYALVEGAVIRTDLTSGREQRLAALPGTGLDLAVTDERVYVVSGAAQNVVWVTALRAGAGTRVESIRVGRGGVGIVVVP
jgi:hypothetical protein